MLWRLKGGEGTGKEFDTRLVFFRRNHRAPFHCFDLTIVPATPYNTSSIRRSKKSPPKNGLGQAIPGKINPFP